MRADSAVRQAIRRKMMLLREQRRLGVLPGREMKGLGPLLDREKRDI